LIHFIKRLDNGHEIIICLVLLLFTDKDGYY